jgi:hypothetical protein
MFHTHTKQPAGLWLLSTNVKIKERERKFLLIYGKLKQHWGGEVEHPVALREKEVVLHGLGWEFGN